MTGGRIVVVGGGHNGLVAAILAADAGYRVTLLERADHLGGASVGAAVFAGHDVRLSRYSYLVSLFPAELATRLGIDLRLASRRVSSFTPVRTAAGPDGLLVERRPGAATEESFRRVTGSAADFRAWEQLYGELGRLAAVLAPALTGPLRTEAEIRDAVVAAAGAQIWTDLVAAPIGEMVTRRFGDDTVRGVVATDALIGTHTSLFDPELAANRCFLYHLIGRGTGEWLVPIGGMGGLADALTARARRAGVEIHCGVEVVAADETTAEVSLAASTADGREAEFVGDRVLAAVAPAVLDRWLGREAELPVGAQVKINMLLDRLPRLASGVDPTVAFAGTTHLEEGFAALEDAYRVSAAGRIPEVVPGEVYCHSLTDPSILGGADGATLTLFGLHTPTALFTADPAGSRDEAAAAALRALQLHLAEPLQDCLSRDADGELCLEVASPLDVEASVGMPGGNIFHGDLSWPWRHPDDDDSPAGRYGVSVPGSAPDPVGRCRIPARRRRLRVGRRGGGGRAGAARPVALGGRSHPGGQYFDQACRCERRRPRRQAPEHRGGVPLVAELHRQPDRTGRPVGALVDHAERGADQLVACRRGHLHLDGDGGAAAFSEAAPGPLPAGRQIRLAAVDVLVENRGGDDPGDPVAAFGPPMVGEQVPVAARADQAVRVDRPASGRPSGRRVVDPEPVPADHRPLHGAQRGHLLGAAHPAVGQHQDARGCRGRGVPVLRRHAGGEFAQGRGESLPAVRRAGGGVRTGRQQRLRFRAGQPGQVGGPAGQQGEPTVPAAFGIDRYTGGGERLDVAQHCPGGHLQLGGEHRRRLHAAVPQQHEKREQTVGAHAPTMPAIPDNRCQVSARPRGAPGNRRSTTADPPTPVPPAAVRSVPTGTAGSDAAVPMQRWRRGPPRLRPVPVHPRRAPTGAGGLPGPPGLGADLPDLGVRPRQRQGAHRLAQRPEGRIRLLP